MAYTLYGIPNCDTVKKARTWLTERGIDFEFHNFKKDGLSEQKANEWLKQESLEVLINKKGTTYKKLADEDKASVASNATAAPIMTSQTSVIKRPILESDGKVLSVGFKPDMYEAIF